MNNQFTKIHFMTRLQKKDKQSDIKTDFKFESNVKNINGKKLTNKVSFKSEIEHPLFDKVKHRSLVVEIC